TGTSCTPRPWQPAGPEPESQNLSEVRGGIALTEKEKSHAEMLYQPGDPELAAERDETVKKLYEYNRLHPLDRDGRRAAIRKILGKTGLNCTVEQPFFCTY